jgi:squalene-hopene/tetraprenyl-beta-curcumene cyclase
VNNVQERILVRDSASARGDESTLERLDEAISDALAGLKALQQAEGDWRFELEADATIPSEYVMLKHYFDEVDTALEARIGKYLRDIQGDHGGWPLYHDGDFNMSATVKAYYALKLIGDSPDAPHMRRAREAVLSHGGAAKSNVFTRITLALFGQVPWRSVPVMPIEIMLLPSWFPFHLDKVSYWSRVVIVPLLIVRTFRPRARNPRDVNIRELFVTPPEEEQKYFADRGPLARAFLAIDRVLRFVEPLFPKTPRERALKLAEKFVLERLNDEHGLGAIYPAMANALMAFDCLGYAKDHPARAAAAKAIDNLIEIRNGHAYCQPCVSPLWDTCLASHAMMEAGESGDSPSVMAAMNWLKDRQILHVKGDWAVKRPDLEPGGWAFQYENAHYPDIDDSAVVVMALDRADGGHHDEAIERGVGWVEGMQSSNGGWGAFDVDNVHDYLNAIPFADHGALLDQPTADVTARCVGMLCQLGYDRDYPAVERGLAFLRRVQEDDGSWHGRWGTNYVYGTWSVLNAFSAAEEDLDSPHIRRAVAWLVNRQHDDGGWGEDGSSYFPETRGHSKASTPSQTAWALLGLMAAGEVDGEAASRGIEYLLDAPRDGARWDEDHYTAVGFPRIFYLKYHGYSAYFPLWALARYRNLRKGNRLTTAYGM